MASSCRADADWRALVATGQLVDVAKLDPTIVIDLRYAGSHNILGHPIYESDMPCLLRPDVARRLRTAQDDLRSLGYGLKIWDAYRPPAAHQAIWRRFSKRHFVADPTDGRGSLHSWGLAVDVTMITTKTGEEFAMPSAFDDFSPAASGIYRGGDSVVFANLRTLQRAMKAAGFIGLSTEWWHYAARNWKGYEPPRWETAVTPGHQR